MEQSCWLVQPSPQGGVDADGAQCGDGFPGDRSGEAWGGIPLTVSLPVAAFLSVVPKV